MTLQAKGQCSGDGKQLSTAESAVVAALRGIDGAAPDWTEAVLRALASAGREQGFKSSATGGEAVGADWTEWLWDCSWREYQDEESWVMRSVPMVAESEWSLSKWKLLHSFDKLLAANAPLRVFVLDGQAGKPRTREVPLLPNARVSLSGACATASAR